MFETEKDDIPQDLLDEEKDNISELVTDSSRINCQPIIEKGIVETFILTKDSVVNNCSFYFPNLMIVNAIYTGRDWVADADWFFSTSRICV